MQAKPAWSVNTRPCSVLELLGCEGLYGHATTAMHDVSTAPPLSRPRDAHIRLKRLHTRAATPFFFLFSFSGAT